MVEVSKPDYISLVNKAGSGFNVTEIVDAIVGAEIVPRRTIQEGNKEKKTSKMMVYKHHHRHQQIFHLQQEYQQWLLLQLHQHHHQ